MNLNLLRFAYQENGIFSHLADESGNVLAVTLEHSFDCKPKVPDGTYTCVRGTHCLHNGVPFETFEVQNVPGHTGILLHKGNSQADSQGCILLGTEMHTSSGYLLKSKEAFDLFMLRMEGIDSFDLRVRGVA